MVLAIVQARMGSSRLPGKSMAMIAERPAIWHLFEQLRHSQRVDCVILATTVNSGDDALASYAEKQLWRLFRGSEEDVLDRYYQAAKQVGCTALDIIVRITGDDILSDPEIVDRVVDLLLADRDRIAHASNNRSGRFPYGADVEAFTFSALEQAWREATLREEREHVTMFIRNHTERFPYVELAIPEDYSHIRLSIDSPEDLEFNRSLFERLYRDTHPPFHLRDVVQCIESYHLRHPRVVLRVERG